MWGEKSSRQLEFFFFNIVLFALYLLLWLIPSFGKWFWFLFMVGVVASPQDGPQQSLPPRVHTLVWPIKYGQSHRKSHLRTSPKGMIASIFCSLLWIGCSGEASCSAESSLSQLPHTKDWSSLPKAALTGLKTGPRAPGWMTAPPTYSLNMTIWGARTALLLTSFQIRDSETAGQSVPTVWSQYFLASFVTQP